MSLLDITEASPYSAARAQNRVYCLFWFFGSFAGTYQGGGIWIGRRKVCMGYKLKLYWEKIMFIAYAIKHQHGNNSSPEKPPNHLRKAHGKLFNQPRGACKSISNGMLEESHRKGCKINLHTIIGHGNRYAYPLDFSNNKQYVFFSSNHTKSN